MEPTQSFKQQQQQNYQQPAQSYQQEQPRNYQQQSYQQQPTQAYQQPTQAYQQPAQGGRIILSTMPNKSQQQAQQHVSLNFSF